ncbi:hypothetical protein [Mycobacterium marseillense]|uniref:hypothetical protein n=1 Tax=Mycobacterium marseillense TaxID=701042 RepID=UPI0039EBB419
MAAFRQLAGGTDPVEKAIPGTIRGDLGLETQSRARLGFDRVGQAGNRALVSRRLSCDDRSHAAALTGSAPAGLPQVWVGRLRDVGY